MQGDESKKKNNNNKNTHSSLIGKQCTFNSIMQIDSIVRVARCEQFAHVIITQEQLKDNTGIVVKIAFLLMMHLKKYWFPRFI